MLDHRNIDRGNGVVRVAALIAIEECPGFFIADGNDTVPRHLLCRLNTCGHIGDCRQSRGIRRLLQIGFDRHAARNIERHTGSPAQRHHEQRGQNAKISRFLSPEVFQVRPQPIWELKLIQRN
ncbi:hypothetical protein D3C87_1438790 [compost metagenome]